MKLKTQDLTGAALDWAVDEARGFGADYLKWWRVGGDKRFTHCEIMRAYSTDWSQGGPIIEREGISIGKADDPEWWAFKGWKTEDGMPGPTPLVAAMRCFCFAKLGDEIDVPEELCQQQSS